MKLSIKEFHLEGDAGAVRDVLSTVLTAVRQLVTEPIAVTEPPDPAAAPADDDAREMKRPRKRRKGKGKMPDPVDVDTRTEEIKHWLRDQGTDDDGGFLWFTPWAISRGIGLSTASKNMYALLKNMAAGNALEEGEGPRGSVYRLAGD